LGDGGPGPRKRLRRRLEVGRPILRQDLEQQGGLVQVLRALGLLRHRAHPAHQELVQREVRGRGDRHEGRGRPVDGERWLRLLHREREDLERRRGRAEARERDRGLIALAARRDQVDAHLLAAHPE
jgi:hypothetical protein